VPHRVIDRIRRTILLRDYDLTVHAMEEMAEDDLDVFPGTDRFLIITVYDINKYH